VIGISICLFLVTIAVYFRVRSFSFLDYDDPESVTADKYVLPGLTPASIAGVFATTANSNWVPITRISHAIDIQLFGLDGGMHHLMNVVLHSLTVALLFALLNSMTRRPWPSAWVAAVFALHPLHVESVAWITERKDVLSGLFAVLSIWSYIRYIERRTAMRYLIICAFVTLGLMSKPMLVTLPLLFLLLDVWPLERIPDFSWPRVAPLLREKIPLFALSAVFVYITWAVQKASGTVQTLEAFPFPLRVANALVSSVVYIRETLWPADLAVVYPYPRAIPAWEIAIAVAVLAAVTIPVFRAIRARPYLAVGWLWYLVMLVPVIGLVQVGQQAHADRYAYLPMIGLTMMIAYSVPASTTARGGSSPAFFAAGAASCIALAAATWNQTAYWRDGATLFRHAIEVTGGDNYMAHEGLADSLAGDPASLSEAIAQFRQALAIKPGSAFTHANFGSALMNYPGGLAEAVREFRTAIAMDPTLPVPHYNLANALAKSEDWSGASPEYERAIQLNIGEDEASHRLATAHDEFGLALARKERPAEAASQFEAELRIAPGSAEAHNNLGVALSQLGGREEEAIAQFRAAVQIDPRFAPAQLNLGIALAANAGSASEALSHLQIAQEISPNPETDRMIRDLKTREASGQVRAR